jgi:DtxR family Mn-dependent transcriptional regulator
MLPSQTVENYLKTIFLAQIALESPTALVPMGQIASTLGVVPGTATTMIKALSESGLVHYEPYLGVRLTGSGERLAGVVVRRHRLIELCLVKVLGLSWAEVHAEAERLEHAVSERLIEKIDEMLYRPNVDPHGDPIPTAEGRLPRVEHESLLSAPVNMPLVVSRVTDQDPDFLRFLEQSRLMPGEAVTIEAHDSAADRVQLRDSGGSTTTIGRRAASKVLVRRR